MRKILFTIIVAVCISLTANAQKQAYNWAFGTNSGLTWNTTRSFTVSPISGTGATATSLTGMPNPFPTNINTWEGCFSLSDANGQLLFYSDGQKVWNKNNAVMPNGTGLTGHNSSTQSGIIFPYPGNANKFVAVSMGEVNQGSSSVVAYSVIDMSLALGLGDVVAGQKNLSFPGASPGMFMETITSIKIPGSNDYWVVAPTANGANFYAWRFTSSGPAAPVVTTISPSIWHTYGYLKITPDGQHFVWASRNSFVCGDFDINTGIISNIKSEAASSGYGIEFSQDQKLVYLNSSTSLIVYKADELFSKPTMAAVTRKTYTGLGTSFSAIQLAPDGRLYINGSDGGTFMLVVDDPNNFDSPKLYRTANGFVPGTTGVGLPSFAANWFNFTPAVKKFACTGYDYKFNVNVDVSGGTNAPVKLSLNYGDGNTGTINLVAGQTTYEITHSYAVAGTYPVTITPVKADNSTLSQSTVSAQAVDCTIRTNRMIRVDLQNSNTATGVQP